MNTNLLIVGAGGHGREIAWLAAVCARAGTSPAPVAFVDDDPLHQGSTYEGLPVFGWKEAFARFTDAQAAIGIGSSATRRTVAARLATQGTACATLVHPNADIASSTTIGTGCVVCSGCIVSVAVTLDTHVHLNRGCQIGHDVSLGAFASLFPGVIVGGNVNIGGGALLGAGALIKNGRPGTPLDVGDNAVIGMGAVVVANVAAHATVKGVPAR